MVIEKQVKKKIKKEILDMCDGMNKTDLIALLTSSLSNLSDDSKIFEKLLKKLLKKGRIEIDERGICKRNGAEDSKSKKRKRTASAESTDRAIEIQSGLNFDVRYILAPMVGASELPFRLLCRKYGASVAYTPMMSSKQFAVDPAYRSNEFQTVASDRPLVCHFSANDPDEFAKSAKLVESQCDAIDLNLGCPQRTAFVGHFGSYLLEPKDRDLICSIVRKGCEAVSIPIFVKIRLLDTLDETIELCKQLRDAGASLIAIHARYRASWCRQGPGARDGPAMLDQVKEIKKIITDIPIVSNGNIITYDDVVNNLQFTKADGVMSAEGILDNPALFLPRLGPNNDNADEIKVSLSMDYSVQRLDNESSQEPHKKRRKLEKKLRQIEAIESKISQPESVITQEQQEKVSKKENIVTTLKRLNDKLLKTSGNSGSKLIEVSLKELYMASENPLNMANEYLSLARTYPTAIRTVVFHTRRICKDLLVKYQLMEECLLSKSIESIQSIIDKMFVYQSNPKLFEFNKDKALREKEALEKKKREEGKRKDYEARMIRKAKREGRKDLEYYLRQGTEVPTVEIIERLRMLPREEQLKIWKKSHSQHCLSHHLDQHGCQRDRKCAFLHSEAKGTFTFNEQDECCG